MRLGLTVFLTDLTIDPVTLAREAEARGFSSLYVPEHTHIPSSRATPFPGGGELPEEYRRTLDPFVAMAMAAAATERLVVGTGIALVAQRDPIVLAKEAATLHLLSGGRFVLGVGFGWNREELDDHGVEFAERREVVRERVLAMRALWQDEVASFEGRHVQLAPSWAWPKPIGGTVPTLVGGGAGPVLFRHVADWADGWMPIGGGGLRESLPRLEAAWAEAGRAGRPVVIPFGISPTAGKLEHYAALGCDEVVARIEGLPRDETLRVLDALAPYAG